MTHVAFSAWRGTRLFNLLSLRAFTSLTAELLAGGLNTAADQDLTQ